MDQHLRAALDNITKHGDTDIFPFPLENHIFYDRQAESLELLKNIHTNFETALTSAPPVNQGMLTSVGYTGFRWATQIDPQWNAYFLALVLKIAPDIEAERIPISKETIFSYRFNWNDETKTIFDQTIGWKQFNERSLLLAKQHKHILICDISDFYPRIYHHRLENALRRATRNTEICNRLMELLKKFAKGVSYGLPVGGPASRLLSELLLNRVDRLLATEGIPFCRFADDYHLFSDSAEKSYRNLVFLSEKLVENEGLLLQKSKTRLLSSEEFIATSNSSDQNPPESEDEKTSRQFLSLRLHFDPYSNTAAEDYEKLKSELSRFDILKMLTREMNKSRIHQTLTRRLISAVKHLDHDTLNTAIISIFDNLAVLYPVFPGVAQLTRDSMDNLDPRTRTIVFDKIRTLIQTNSHITAVPTNLAYTTRLLAHDKSEEADSILDKIYKTSTNTALRRDVILAMAKREAAYWISDIKQGFSTQTPWEKTATVIASYILGDEGKHWRHSIEFTPMQKLAADWAASKKKTNTWGIPI
ncbi:RNA-directed DNA polymerase [Corallococcus exiguus]|uniref:RNA-directed DNA polymerase n=1 Tax=Corallococcus exiguus TaxID=83462 RepID=UPI001494D9C4|nr:RNA-directed DNA polymerase [Corallococcus exiguus]NPC70533.1 RNA-directed DNA polymerase [Corallococcus exiguus]